MSEKETYRIQYVDNTYQIVEWTEEDLATVYCRMETGKLVAIANKSVFRLDHIRAIVHLEKEQEPETTEEPQDEETVVLTEMGAYEKEIYELLVAEGIELGDVLGERRKTR